MATKVLMEALSPTMTEGRVTRWLKREGEQVKSGEPLAEVETDKAVMELTARGDGVLRKILVLENATVEVGSLVAIIAGAQEDIASLAGDSPAEQARQAPKAAPPAAAPRRETAPRQAVPVESPPAAPPRAAAVQSERVKA